MNAPAQVGKYRLVRKIATGGMAEVYLAQAAGPAGFQKTLVLKRILPHLVEDQQFVEMFLNEARLAALLNHPNIVQIFDLGETAGNYFIAMEYIDGPNLRGMCRKANETGMRIPYEYAAKMIAYSCEGLGYAHDFADNGQPLNLIHRDISPDNILISRSGAVKVVDFGIAKAANQGHLTKTGTLKGKLAYMPPEQLRGKPLDRRADIFALGVVFYELVAGMKPFDATSEVAAMQAILHEDPTPLRQHRADCPAELVRIIERSLEKDRENRYPDCRAMQQDIEKFLVGIGKSVSAYDLAQFINEIAPVSPMPVQHTPLPNNVPQEVALQPPAPPRPATPVPQPPRQAPPPVQQQYQPQYQPPPPPVPQQYQQQYQQQQPQQQYQQQQQYQGYHTPVPPAPQRGQQLEPVSPSRSHTLVDDAVPIDLDRGSRSWPLIVGAAAAGLAVVGAAAYFLFKPADPPPAAPAVPPVAVAPPAPAPAAEQPNTPVVKGGAPEVAVAPAIAPAAVPSEPAAPAAEQPAQAPPAQPAPVAPPVAQPPPQPQIARAEPASNRRPRQERAERDPIPEPPPPAPVAPPPAPVAQTLLKIEAEPPCIVMFNGESKGMSPVEVRGAPSGQYTLELSNREKGLKRRLSGILNSGETKTERVVFGQGTIKFLVRPWAQVEVDGKSYGPTPLPDGVKVYEGERRVRLYNPELNKEQVRQIFVTSDQETTIKANLAE